MTSELKPCPFCKSVPEFPNGDGTQYEIECNDCGQAIVSVQICDLMTIDERASHTFHNYRYPEEFVNRAKATAVERWNTRAVPDVPELVRYKPDLYRRRDDTIMVNMSEDEEGEYVRYDQAAAAIAKLIPREPNCGRYLAECNDGKLLYLNHANAWQECPNFIETA